MIAKIEAYRQYQARKALMVDFSEQVIPNNMPLRTAAGLHP